MGSDAKMDENAKLLDDGIAIFGKDGELYNVIIFQL